MDAFPVRAFRRDTDVSPLLQLLQDVEAFDKTGERWSSEKLELYLSAPEHNPETDRWVVAHPDDAAKHIGHAVLYLPGRADDRRVADGMVVIHPAWRRRGLASKLAAHLQKRLREGQNILSFRVYLDPRQKGPKAFVARWGLGPNPADSYRLMRGNIADVNLKFSLSEGFTLHSYSDIQHPATVVEAMNRSYAGLYGHRMTSEAAFTPILEMFDWDGFFLLFDARGRVAGTVSAEAAPDLTEATGVSTGRLGSPGVVPEYRSAELYKALLLAGMAYLKTRDVVVADLETWGEPETTIKLYKTLGFALKSEALAYTKNL